MIASAPCTSTAAFLGGVESLAEHRAAVEKPHGVGPRNLLRLSAGIEAVEDVVADLDQAPAHPALGQTR